MLFNSASFVLVFLPVTLCGYFLLNGQGCQRLAIAWLVAMSAVFYGWFSTAYLSLLVVLIVVNYAFGFMLSRDFREGQRRPMLLAAGVLLNIGVLGYFKYTNFFLGNLNSLFGTDFVLMNILLPIGISFFTFQKIAYLVDAYRGEAQEYDFLDFSLFVLYFPQLIAGPIVHHKEMIPQFLNSNARHFSAEDLAAGLALFTIGLIKKVLVADTLVGWSDPVFASAHAGQIPSLYAAWTGALAFTLQIYFDFSGYTDMALGLALMIGIRLPLNFNSPYKATSIIDFWRRWHMTLSRFLRDYIYIPLGGNRRGPRRRMINLMLTMLIGGFWHGAAWTFIVWGALHGAYIIINHGWHRIEGSLWLPLRCRPAGRWLSCCLTFAAVTLAWIFFRAESFAAAITMLRGLVSFHHIDIPLSKADAGEIVLGFFTFIGTPSIAGWLTRPVAAGQLGALAILLAAVFLLPNSQQLLAGLRPALQSVKPATLGRKLGSIMFGQYFFTRDGSVRLSALTGVIFGALLIGVLLLQALSTVSLKPFIYFQF